MAFGRKDIFISCDQGYLQAVVKKNSIMAATMVQLKLHLFFMYDMLNKWSWLTS